MYKQLWSPVTVACVETAVKQRFWDIDLVELFKVWIDDMGTFFWTALTFVGLALPVLIPTLILWFLSSINWSMAP